MTNIFVSFVVIIEGGSFTFNSAVMQFDNPLTALATMQIRRQLAETVGVQPDKLVLIAITHLSPDQ